MARYRLTHDLDDDPTVQDSHVLDEPLEFSDGEAVVDDEDTARQLAERHTHVQFAGRVVDGGDADGEAAGAEADTGGEDETPDSVEDAPVDPREYTIGELDDDLDDRDLNDDQLDALAQAERDTQDREGALDTIDDYRSENGTA